MSGSKDGQTSSITGNMKIVGDINQTGNLVVGGITVNTHKHTNPEGGDVGPMKA